MSQIDLVEARHVPADSAVPEADSPQQHRRSGTDDHSVTEALEILSESVRHLVETHRVDGAMEWLDNRPPHVIADALARMDAVQAGVVFRLLDKDRAITVFEELEPVDQQQILQGLREKSFRDLVEAMDPDDRARMLHEAPAKVAKKVLAGLSPRERRMTAALLGYPEGSVGQYMTPEVVALPDNLTVAQALSWAGAALGIGAAFALRGVVPTRGQ
ncbi:magnesium transporter MgtE N-terminal domain-containing protein, partial [Streptomyces sp. NPDC004980]